MSGSFIQSARLLAGMTLLSRILGMARDMLAASVFGLTAIWDAFAIAFLVPNLFRRLFGEGALASSFVPVFVEHLERDGKPAASRLLSALCTGVVLILTAVSAAGIVAALVLPHVSGDAQVARVCGLLAIMLPYMILICVVAVLSAALNSVGHFAAPAAAPVLLNVFLIGTLLFVAGDAHEKIVLFAWAVVAAGALQVALQLWPLRAHGIRLRPSLAFDQPGVREIKRLFLPATLGVGILQINELVDKIIAGIFVDEGGVSALYFSDRFVFLPLSMIGVALATAVLPTLSRATARDDREGFDAEFARGLRVAIFLSVPAATGLLLLAEPLIRVVFERGEFDAVATARTARVLFFYSTGLLFFTCNHLFVRAFYAHKDTATPFRIMGSMVALNLVLNLVLVQTPLREAGLALATAITGALNLLALGAALRRRHGVRVGRGVAASLGASLLIAAVHAPALYVLRDPAFVTLPSEVVRLVLCLVAGAGITFALGCVWARREVRDILGRG